ncbi:MAG: D-glycero-alpha-D-manno-heptose-1,7-bisphosphate 7-phosphatase [bacterium]
MPRKAVFLDRDDTLLNTLPDTADLPVPGDLLDPSRAHLLPGVGQACRRLLDAGYLIVLYTNQGGIARGSGTLRGFEAVDDRLRELLQPFGVTLAGVYACPFHPVGSVPEFTQEHQWRKPAPGMLASAVAELDLDLAQSWAAGDKPRDVEAAVSAGIARERCFLLATSGEAGARCADLPAAVELILA